ncbi:asparagine--tRNA ligase SLM5 [Aspergillus tanneri]|uniref:Asparaginyl-tRNA synthetase n=1 Tax=Aspergillus tanneri TaxID=1220188 RepID=A0A5M9MU92_9EURO|nr:Asparaginyl-tRNA synthetase [Aspergillus tanneri]KAA8646067.1 Asparaginyl-tRNA synthetase [Aspergillus tanneri]
MLIWRRAFATSVARLNRQPPQSVAPTLLRCAQALQKSQDGSSSLENQDIKLQGVVRSVRKQKRFAFAEISDGSTIEPVQAFLNPTQAAEYVVPSSSARTTISLKAKTLTLNLFSLSTGTAVEISGAWKACPLGKKQSHELQTTAVKVVGKADELGNSFRNTPNGGFCQVHPPLITSSDCEGAGETFTVMPREMKTSQTGDEHFFRAPKYLTVSSQLHLEAYAAELGNVWTISPTFRAEKSDTPRHLSEFYMLEAEMNFMADLDSLTGFVEYLLRDVIQRLYNTPVGQEVLSAKRSGAPGQETAEGTDSALRQKWLNLMDGPKWSQMTYTQAIELLQDAVAKRNASFEYAPTWTGGLQLEHEKYIVDEIHGGRPVFVTDYPKEVKPFYMAPSEMRASNGNTSPAPGETVACFDLLLPEVSEVAGGSLREHRLPNIIQNMREHGLIKTRPSGQQSPVMERDGAGKEDWDKPLYPYLQRDEDLGHLEWYADLRRWGTAPHGGFGLGFDRFLGYLTGMSSVRDVVAFPRYFGRADC